MLTVTFVVDEEKQTVVNDGAADVTAEDVINQVQGFIGQARSFFSRFVEEIIGLAKLGAIEFVSATMEGIGSPLGDERGLCSLRIPLRSPEVGGGDAEFLDGGDGHGKYSREGGSSCITDSSATALVVDVNAIESDVVLVAMGAIDGAAARVVHRRVITVSSGDYTGLKRQKSGDIATVQWHLANLSPAERIALAGVSGVQKGRLPGDLDRGGRGANFHPDIDSGRQVHEQFEPFLLEIGKAAGANVERVVAGHYLSKHVAALLVGGGGALQVRVDIGQAHSGVGNGSVARVRDCATKGCGGLRPRGTSGEEERGT